MEVEAVVEAGVGEVDEVRGRHRHLIEVDLACDVARRGLERGRGVGHCFGLLRRRSRADWRRIASRLPPLRGHAWAFALTHEP